MPAMFPLYDQNERGRGPAFVTLAFIGVNVAVFILLQGAGATEAGAVFTFGFSAVPYEITNGVDLVTAQPVVIDGQPLSVPQEPGPTPIWLTLFSSMFMHGDWLHLGGNMLFLWVFGDNVEHRIGHFVFVLFYLAVGVMAAAAHILLHPDSVIPMLGASGAIAGVLGAYLVLFPGNRVLVLLLRFPVWVPAIVAIGMWIVLQVVGGFATPTEGGGVAYAAHIGGFMAGAAGGVLFRLIAHEPRHPRGTDPAGYR
jgi:membrane associated rhomboid family serine protease